MPIRIKCPKCQTILGVKESLAGKKVNCPKCRFVLVIPIPKPAVAAPTPQDAEALALSAFADEPVKSAPVETKVIEFECPYCVEMIKVSAEHSGKQTPCPNPECKRIIKVPLLKEEKAKDWRQINTRSTVEALRAKADEPEGTWSTAQKTRVSAEALVEADAIPVKKPPMPIAAKVRRAIIVVVAVAAIGSGAWGVMAWMANNRLQGPFKEALAQADSSNSKLSAAATANILRGAGEFQVIKNNRAEAVKHFNKARGKLAGNVDPKAKPDPERDTVLIELALALVDFGGSPKEVDDEMRLDWGEVQKELGRTLMLIGSMDAKQTASATSATA